MKFSKVLACALAAVTTASMLAACGNGDEGDTTKGTTTNNDLGSSANVEETAGTYLIGGIGPLTGENASYGISVQNGCQIAIDEINAAGGINGYKLELIFEDDVADEEKAIAAYNRLMDEGITALVGAVTSGSSIAVGQESVNDGILQITPSGSAAKCTEGFNAFRICFTDPLQGQTMARYISEQGITKVAILYNNADEYSSGITEAFIAEAETLGIEIVANETFSTDDVDFKTQLTTIKATDAECLFLPVYYDKAALITEQAVTVGLELPYFGCDGWDGIIKQLNGDTSNIEGATFLTPFVATSEKENVKAFVSAYEEAYCSTPDQFAADGYDAIYAIKAAIEVCDGDVTNENLVAAMTEITVNGVTGDMTFTAEGEPNKSALVAVIENGEYVAK